MALYRVHKILIEKSRYSVSVYNPPNLRSVRNSRVIGFRFASNSADALGSREACGVKDHEALQPGAVVRELAQAVQHEIHDLLT